MFILRLAVLAFLFLAVSQVAFSQNTRLVSGGVITTQFEIVSGITVNIRAGSATLTTVTNAEGRFSAAVPLGDIEITISGRNILPFSRSFATAESVENIQLKIVYSVPPIAENVTIQVDTLTPDIEFKNDAIYKNTLFGRDDQLIHTLNAGINAGQHEGGGKSLEIRRYGFNLDHGGLNGGLKILVDNVQQNQGTQGHGQGYLGSLKSLSPELVEDVSIINGPFSAAHGDFSGLGVVQIRLKESLPDIFTARVQGGSFKTFRGFFAYSPKSEKVSSYFAYEPSYTDGPFVSPLRYRRDNLAGNLTYKLDDTQAIGFKFNAGRNNFFSSGQIPLDLVVSGELDRVGFIDPENGGRVRLGSFAGYYRKEMESGATFKADAFVGRSLFDLFSNFTFFTADPVFGDEIQQHDSRLQEGVNVQYFQPYKLFGTGSLLTIGGNIHANQVNVGLYPSVNRVPNRKFLPSNIDNPDVVFTQANAKINNYAAYVQNGFSFADGHLRLDVGLRYDYFTFSTNGFEQRETRVDLIGQAGEGRFQPKIALAWSPFDAFPVSLYANYGRGISSQDARGVARNPDAPRLSTTDFYQAGTSYNGGRFSGVFSGFLIDRSNEQVYIPDDGSVELAGPTRSYGIEARTTVKLTKHLSFNGGLTNVINAFFRGEFTADNRRIAIDSAPHFVANAGLVLSEYRGFNSSLSFRHISNYRLDGEDSSLRASGNDVLDFAISKRLRTWVDVNFAIDNLLNKRYFETQNFFESRACQTCEILPRIHATPGYPFTATVGLTFRIGRKN
ncbi:MAG: TonB-dependent receptor [Pyrinomonadaceae bacterium]